MSGCGRVHEGSAGQWESAWFEAILDNRYADESPLVPVWVGHIPKLPMISRVMRALNESMPLPGLQHLKRVKRVENGALVIIEEDRKDGSDEGKRMKMDMLTVWKDRGFDFAKFGMTEYSTAEVAKLPPKTRPQYERAVKYWPVNFHPEKDLEALIRDSMFGAEELARHLANMKMVVTEGVERTRNTALVVDSEGRALVKSWTRVEEHPLQHTIMTAVDGVAKTQGGGAWDLPFEDLLIHTPEPPQGDEGPYLCTGYDLYVVTEPCVMCAMSLVHSRVRQVFFWLLNTQDGALVSRCKLHTMPDLNHHFQVFRLRFDPRPS